MDNSYIIDKFAIHFINKRKAQIEIAKEEQDVQNLDPLVIQFLKRIIEEVWDAEDLGNINSAKFTNSTLSKQLPEKTITAIKSDEGDFFQHTVKLARHLYEKTPGNASPGLLGILRLEFEKNKVYVAILKIQVKDEKFIRLGSTTLTQITVEDVENLLLEKIQKGAIYPHPVKSTYDLKVIDKQSADEPALYFKDFLGCIPKRSDEHQVKKLIPELQKYSKKSNLPFANEKVPELIIALKKQNKDITTPVLARVVKEADIYGDEYDSDAFINYINDESPLGPIDIPREKFIRRPIKRYQPREIILTFNDPNYYGMKLIGPDELIARIMETDGDTVSFHIETTPDGYTTDYE